MSRLAWWRVGFVATVLLASPLWILVGVCRGLEDVCRRLAEAWRTGGK